MIELLIGFVLGVLVTLMLIPIIAKKYIKRKINKLTGGLLG